MQNCWRRPPHYTSNIPAAFCDVPLYNMPVPADRHTSDICSGTTCPAPAGQATSPPNRAPAGREKKTEKESEKEKERQRKTETEKEREREREREREQERERERERKKTRARERGKKKNKQKRDEIDRKKHSQQKHTCSSFASVQTGRMNLIEPLKAT